MRLKFDCVDAIEGIQALAAELTNLKGYPNSTGVLFMVFSGKRITLFNTNADSPKSVSIGRNGNSMLRYVSKTSSDDPAQEGYVEVVRNHEEHLFFRE